MNQQQCDIFTEHRPFLLALALKILGRCSEAEDLVEETFVRWNSVEFEKVESPKAFLATILTRLCINHLNSARVRAEVSLDALEPDIFTEQTSSAQTQELSDSLSEAFNLLVQKLSTNERIVFLLREVFEFEYDEIADILSLTADNCRQLLKRARDHISGNRTRFEAPAALVDSALRAFSNACHTGDFDTLIAAMLDDVSLINDGGGLVPPQTISGHTAVIHFLKHATPEHSALSIEPLGSNAFYIRVRNQHHAVMIKTKTGKIQQLTFVSCPVRLQKLRILTNAFQNLAPLTKASAVGPYIAEAKADDVRNN